MDVNLNEIAKVKHILSLAQAINAKLDGDGSAFDTSIFDPVDPRADNTITLGTSTTVDPTFTMAQLQTGIQQRIRSTSNGTPYVSYVATGVKAGITYVSDGTSTHPWIYLNNNDGAQAGKACTITIDGDDTYKPATLDIILTD